MSNEVTCHFVLLPKREKDNADEIRHYSCSECDDDIFNINVHAQVEHDTLLFDIDPEETARITNSDAPFHPCGVLGCDFPAHESGPHSWQQPTAEEIGKGIPDAPDLSGMQGR